MKVKISKKSCALGVLILLCALGVLCFLLKKSSRTRTVDAQLLAKGNSYFMPIKIDRFSSAGIPCLEVNIEGRTVPVKVDLGYEGDICFLPDIIKELTAKKFIKRRSSYGLRGKTYTSDIYEVEKIYIDNISFGPVKAEELNLELAHDIHLGGEEVSSESNLGRLGWSLFYNCNLLIDCKHSILALCDGLETLKDHGYPVDFFTETCVLLDRGFIEFEAMTEVGMIRCVLDTGSTWNLLNKDLVSGSNDHMLFTPENVEQYSVLNPENKSLLTFDAKNVCELPSFKVLEKEFGPMTFNCIKSPLAIDAIVGMEFFETTLIFIDFLNKKLYFYEYPK